MNPAASFNPDRYMADLRHILASGRKRIGILLGAGTPMSMSRETPGAPSGSREPLIPDIAGLTRTVTDALGENDRKTVEILKDEIDGHVNIEAILTKVRQLASAIGHASIHGLDGHGYSTLAEKICNQIGRRVAVFLPEEGNPYSHIVSWISGTQRDDAVEIFTPNYDLLMEEAFERARVPYFDGFIGSCRAFFNPSSVATDHLPSRWSLLWKLHGSLGWRLDGDTFVRTGNREDTELIYPDHLKYDKIGRLPYSAFFERLRTFLTTPDTLLICSGFSFSDSHICSAIVESLSSNRHTAVLAFQYGRLADESNAVECAQGCPNLSVYARDGAVINGVAGSWNPGPPDNADWENIRRMFWRQSESELILGDFAQLALFLALTTSPSGSGTDPYEHDDRGNDDSASSVEARGGDRA